MKKIFLTLLIATLFISFGTAQNIKKVDVDNFSSVSFGVSGTMTIEQGNSFSVTLEGDEDLLDEITTKVSDGRLVIRKPNWRRSMNKRLTVYITMPEIEGLSVSGSGNVVNRGNLKCDDLTIAVSGSGNIKLDNLSATDVDMGISGSGSVNLEGSGAENLEISISGSGSVYAESFRTNSVEAGISGSGRCKLWVEESLQARISGSGSIYYKGDPNIDSRSSGSGKVRKL